VTICLVGLIAFVALAIDIGMMAVARTQAQSAADIAAMAGTRTLNGNSGNNKTSAEAEAVEAATSNYILGTKITSSQVDLINTGVYRYDATNQRFVPDFNTAPTGNEAYGAMRVRVSTDQATYFGRVLGVNSMNVSAVATAVHRPRDIAISLDFSGSMKFSSEFNYPPISGSTQLSGGLNPDPTFPRFGPWVIYPVATSGTPNPMQRLEAYVDSGGETHAANNITINTDNGPPIVNDFQTTAANNGPNALVYGGDLTAASFNINNTPVCTPAPSDWTSQYASGYAGDRWPLKWGVSTTTPNISHYAFTAAEVVGIQTVTTSSRDANWETDGYDYSNLTSFTNGPFKGYTMGPGYYGKSFYVWPPDPRYDSAADPTSISTSNPVKDTSDRWMADWRKRFFLNPGSSSTKGTPINDNSKLWTSTGVWQTQNLGGTLRYIPNYDAILQWIKNGPQTLPPSLRAGRVLYYSAIPDSIPMNWQTGIIGSGATADQRFWKCYIDYVIGCGEHNRGQTLYGVGTNNTWGSSTFGTGKITAATSLTGTPKPYMAYDDTPVHPRLHTWFGPLTMLGFLSINSNNRDFNWYAGTTHEAQTWQLKVGIQSALDDIKKNHPNDLVSLNFWSSFNSYYLSPRVTMGRDYDKMKNCLYFPFSLIDTLGTASNEMLPYATATAGSSNPAGLDFTNYESNIPLGAGGTNPSMGLMVSYNQFNWTGGYSGRKGSSKIVILETDGVANQKMSGTFSSISGGNGAKHWTSMANGGSAPSPMNGHPDALNPAITLAWLICQDSTGSKPWPSYPAYTAITGLSATTPTKYTGWSGMTTTGPGFSTTRSPARIHTLAFGYLFEDSTTSELKTRALEFLRNIQTTSGIPADPTTGTIESYKMITGTYDQRIAKIKEAMERIFQGGIQVALIE
jgi:hypothetical protein